ncbi:DNA-binding IclR family transcriptional regulator [Paraburkholderia sp. GAS199]|uniref:IclR family transcriptional regulator n=1 Tax=Paraburkholderia sp. GAS199 TaxID=3035126 RepID=UPI003D190F94
MATEEPGVAAVNRALSILKAFEDSIDGMTLTDLTNATGLYHSTILRLCESLEHFGYLKRLEDGRYMLGPMVFHLGMIYQSSFRLRDYALPVLRTLVKETGETAAVYVREGDERLCLYRVEWQRSVRMHVREGERLTLDAGAAGHVLRAFSGTSKKAHLNKVREDGYCVSLGEREPESAAIACPVFRTGQELVCAISLGVPRFRFDRKAFDVYLPKLMEAGAALTKALGGDTTPFEPPFAHFHGV